MNIKKLIIATLATGLVVNIYDYVLHEQILSGFYSNLSGLLRQDTPIQWLLVGNFVAALVFVWVYDKVYGSFGGGPKGGATFGLYAGILINFPAWIFSNLLIQGFTYQLSWVWTIAGIVWAVIAGVVTGYLYKR